MHDDDRLSANRLGFADAPVEFTGPTQIARVQTESWASQWLYCPNCGESQLTRFTNNRPAADLYCRECSEEFELKSKKGALGRKVVDGAYATLVRRVVERNNPSLVLLSYDGATRSATDIIVVPKHFFVPDIIERRPPLSAKARRAGWVGCNILIDAVPSAGRISMLRAGIPEPRSTVLEQWRQTTFLQTRALEARGWLLEVMKAVETVGRPEFTLADVYQQETRLQALFPNNRHVRPKIRQQLQVLRDAGYLQFDGGGAYRLVHPPA